MRHCSLCSEPLLKVLFLSFYPSSSSSSFRTQLSRTDEEVGEEEEKELQQTAVVDGDSRLTETTA